MTDILLCHCNLCEIDFEFKACDLLQEHFNKTGCKVGFGSITLPNKNGNPTLTKYVQDRQDDSVN